ncbi:NrfD/PsrC family molybdoenzyme membrane anchor subunit [Streptomyces sp. TS71-3]|uniref:NrfD/PsrC family molybdoenzyme membrane anchor subunit n=1 Tax=Streptomyces sp. TS71-3 TaxID=2733862 RepID=UPI001B119958|nr:NrfD/PsrC family molybdoenzyme membrane anchor subunit [Streptomyces sp. TS71-3]GHJ42510.1 polysulfide reductase [Streptomyces sp. TS71-3]
MSNSDVTRHGIEGERPGRQATPGALRQGPRADPDGAGTGRRGRRRRGGEEPMVPRADFTSYYGRPVIKAPSWAARDIAGYFFLGGLAGAGSVLAAGAHLTGRTRTATAMKVSSTAAVSLSAAALVHDLGRPERFAGMLRVFKPTSPMSVGSWLLAGYGPAAAASALSAVTGRLPRAGAAATAVAGLLGPAVAAYTGVLAADTAVPAWHGAHRELPYLFTASATAAASGMALVLAPPAQTGPARYAAALATGAEHALTQAIERRLGPVAETYRTGRAGLLLRCARVLVTTGAAGALLAGRSRPVAALSGLALLAGSACTRFGVFAAGVASAEDPVYTVGPQRARLAAEGEPGPDGAGRTGGRDGHDAPEGSEGT